METFPVMLGSDQVMCGMFMTVEFSLKYNWFGSLFDCKVLSRY